MFKQSQIYTTGEFQCPYYIIQISTVNVVHSFYDEFQAESWSFLTFLTSKPEYKSNLLQTPKTNWCRGRFTIFPDFRTLISNLNYWIAQDCSVSEDLKAERLPSSRKIEVQNVDFRLTSSRKVIAPTDLTVTGSGKTCIRY